MSDVKKKKLHEIVAIEKGIKQRCYSELTEIHKRNQNSELFNGLHKEFFPLNEDGEKFPSETKKVQFTATDSLIRAAKLEAEAINIRATKDASNCTAKANIVIDGTVLAEDVPVTTLLDLEKRAKDWAKFVSELPELDGSETWSVDPTDEYLFRSEVKKTHKTTKIVEHNVVVPPTEHHPAQIKDDTRDVITGHWHQTKSSGAIARNRKRQLLDKAHRFIDAVKQARERANSSEATELSIGKGLFDYLVS